MLWSTDHDVGKPIESTSVPGPLRAPAWPLLVPLPGLAGRSALGRLLRAVQAPPGMARPACPASQRGAFKSRSIRGNILVLGYRHTARQYAPDTARAKFGSIW